MQISFEGLSEEVLQGQLLKATFVIRNEGAAPACEIDLKLSQPCFVFYIESDQQAGKQLIGDGSGAAPGAGSLSAAGWGAQQQQDSGLVPLWGQSCTVVRLPAGTIIPPGEQLRLCAWLRIGELGKQRISVLASYKALLPDGSAAAFGPSVSSSPSSGASGAGGGSARTSFVSIEVAYRSVVASCSYLFCICYRSTNL